MTPEQFCYWLQGRAELLPEQAPTAEEWQSIREHLALVFAKVTPQLGDGIIKDGPDHHMRPGTPSPQWPWFNRPYVGTPGMPGLTTTVC